MTQTPVPVSALKLLEQPYAWAGLKRALAGHEIRIKSLAPPSAGELQLAISEL